MKPLLFHTLLIFCAVRSMGDSNEFNYAEALQKPHDYKAESNHDWWKDFGAGNFAKVAAFNLMRLAPSDERFHAELQLYCSRFAEYKQTPGGLRLREWFAHEYGSLRHANNAAVIAMYYSEHVEKAPVLSGNTWWKANRSSSELQAQYSTIARQQVDYALGANPYRRSFLVGFGNQPTQATLSPPSEGFGSWWRHRNGVRRTMGP